MRKIHLGILLGIFAGIIDVLPMLAQNLSWDADISAFTLWIVSGFLIASSDQKLKGPLKGLLISLMVLLPCAVLIGWNAPSTLVPILAMTLILGSLLGGLIDKYGR